MAILFSFARFQDEALDTDEEMLSAQHKKPGGSGRASSSRHGLRSLAAAVTLSAALTALSLFASHSSSLLSPPKAAATVSTTTLAMVRAGSVASETVLALEAWMAWAEGGVHARPVATLLPYAAQLGAQLAWVPLVLSHGTARVGLACCAAMDAAAVACARGFGAVNPVAGNLAKTGLADPLHSLKTGGR